MFFFLAVTLFLALLDFAHSLSCKNESNQFVDWYYIQKYRNGLDYAYIDSNSARKALKLVGKSLECNYNCAFGATLSPLFAQKTAYVRVLWNDNVPGVSTSGDAAYSEDVEYEGNLRRRLQSGTSGHTKVR